MQEVLKFSRSDGDASCWPACEQSSDGERWERLENDNDAVMQYLDKLSVQLSDQFGRPRNPLPSLPTPTCTLTCTFNRRNPLTSGWICIVHQAHHEQVTTGSLFSRHVAASLVRQEVFNAPPGSRHVKRFRSPAEFAPHAFWLLNDLSLECINCLCKYCGKKPTRTVKRSESIISRPTTPSLVTRAQRISRTSSSLTQTSRTSVGKEAKRLFRVSKAPRDVDPNGPRPSPSDTEGGSFYRNGEIVWLVLNNPVMLDYADGAVDGFVIRFWPCIIEMCEDHESRLGVPCDHQTAVIAPPRIRLFSGLVYHVPQHHILPFWAHSPDELWIQKLRLQTHKTLLDVQDAFAGFSRVLGSQSDEETALAFTTGDLLSYFLHDIEVTSEVVRSWSTSPGTSPRSGGEPIPAYPHTSVTPALCHELWWGAERIMLGDLIRLKIPESKLGKLGADRILFIPGPLPEPSAEATPAGGSEMEDAQLFFKLRSLAIIDGRNGRALHGFGGLYRLVPVGPGLLPPLTGDGRPVLPCPPEGLTFQPVLQDGWEIELSLHYIDGRYYPRIQEFLPESSGVDAYVLEVLEGLLCWKAPPSRPIYFKKGSREEVITRAVAKAEGLSQG